MRGAGPVTSFPSQYESMARAFEGVATARRSVYFFREDPVSRPLLDWALDLATLAPNHHKTRPWRFHVFADAGRRRLADAFAAAAVSLGRDVERSRSKAFASPIVVAVSCVPQSANPKVRVEEELLATAASIQNLLLALASVGIGAIWTTGDLVDSAEMRRAVGLDPDRCSKVIGLIYVGFPDPARALPRRQAKREPATWFTD